MWHALFVWQSKNLSRHLRNYDGWMAIAFFLIAHPKQVKGGLSYSPLSDFIQWW
jgi:hypothetical protein